MNRLHTMIPKKRHKSLTHIWAVIIGIFLFVFFGTLVFNARVNQMLVPGHLQHPGIDQSFRTGEGEQRPPQFSHERQMAGDDDDDGGDSDSDGDGGDDPSSRSGGGEQDGGGDGGDDDDDGDDDDESFSACLMWRDDNFRLEEWLAYHYYIMKLRYVVIGVDNGSKTSVDAIIDRWTNEYKLNMTIVKMEVGEYLSWHKKQSERLENNKDLPYEMYMEKKLRLHRYRQVSFYSACADHLIENDRSWTSFIDIDEFLSFHSKNRLSKSGTQKMEQPGYILNRLNEIRSTARPDSHVNHSGISCVLVRRWNVGAKELTAQEVDNFFEPSSNSSVGRIVPEGFMGYSSNNTTHEDRKAIVRRFDSLRFKYKAQSSKNGNLPKGLMDLSQPNAQNYSSGWHIHKPMRDLCQAEDKNRLPKLKSLVHKEGFSIYHFVGSWESYSFRADIRGRNYTKWEQKSASRPEYSTEVLQPWLKGFVELVGGVNVASYLMQDAGMFPEDIDSNSTLEKDSNSTLENDSNSTLEKDSNSTLEKEK